MLSNHTYSYMTESTIHDLLKCKLCSKPFVEPVTTEKGDCFCRACITQILLRRTSENNFDSITNANNQPSVLQKVTPVTERLVLDMLDSLLVRCTQCDETNIPRGKLEEHKNQACTQATVLCTAADIKCPWIGPREELDRHRDRCDYEPLRPVLGEIFSEQSQLKVRLQKLEAELNELSGEQQDDS